ncbi:MAG: hypothetical protein ACK4G1_05215, partial [Ignavibacteria bacterium]
MRLLKYSIYLLLVIFISCSTVKIPDTIDRIDQNDIYKHLSFLASDELKGRGTGTLENDRAAEYIAKYF